MNGLTSEQIETAREWCLDCWPHDEEEIREATPEQLARVIARCYAGGLAEFAASNS
jgi:broad specificity phosphatase PhoE